MQIKIGTAMLVVETAVLVTCGVSKSAAEPATSTNRPALVELRAKERTMVGPWKWLSYNQKKPAGAAAEFPDVKYGRWAVETDAPRSTLVPVLFKGSVIRVTGGKGPDHGTADVVVDGKRVQMFDAYGPAQVCDQVLCEVTGLDPNQDHEVRVVTKREKNPKSTGRRVIIEKFEADAMSDFADKYGAAAAAEMKQIAAGEKPYLKPEQWKPVAYGATAPLNGVTLDGGPMREAFDLNIKYLNLCFEMTGRYKGKNPGMGWDGYLPGSGDGKMLGGAGNTLRWGERADMREVVDAVMGVIKTRQRADGYCMSFPEENMKSGGNAWFDERRNYARVNWTRGMAAAALAGNADALPIMRKYYDWLAASPYPPGLIPGKFGGSSHNCNNGNDGHTLMYFSAQGKPEDMVNAQRYLVQDFHIAATRTGNPYTLSQYPLHVPHSYVLLAYKFWLDMYRGTGDAKFLEGAKGGWVVVHNNFLNHGAITICEGDRSPPRMYWIRSSLNKGNPRWLGGCHPNETCGTVFWADINHRLLQFFPTETKYADDMESAIFNVMMACQDTRGVIHYHNVQAGHKEVTKAPFNSCCEVMASPLLGALPQFVYSVADDGVYVNLYAPSTLTGKVRMTTDFPATGRVKIENTVPVHLRIPGWVTRPVPVELNGKVVVTGQPGSYVTVKGAGKIEFALPMDFRTELYTGADENPEHPTYSLVYGPILMALVGADDLDIPAGDLPGKLQPVAGKLLHFTVAGRDGVHFQPYWQIQTEAFTCFPTMR